MRYTSIILATAAACLVVPAQAEAQSRQRQTLREGRPLVLRVTPHPNRDPGSADTSRYGQTPWYLAGSTYEPINAFDPIELVPPLGAAANITITLPVWSTRCRITQVNG